VCVCVCVCVCVWRDWGCVEGEIEGMGVCGAAVGVCV